MLECKKKPIWIFVKSYVYENVCLFSAVHWWGVFIQHSFPLFLPLFFCATRYLSTAVFWSHGMGFCWYFTCMFKVTRYATWYFKLTCEVCTIFIMLVLASLALNKSCVATLITTPSFFWIGSWYLGLHALILSHSCLFEFLWGSCYYFK